MASKRPGYALFPGGPGRTTTPEAFNSLMSGLEERVFGRLPDETGGHPRLAVGRSLRFAAS